VCDHRSDRALAEKPRKALQNISELFVGIEGFKAKNSKKKILNNPLIV
jgi:hypothetical protein